MVVVNVLKGLRLANRQQDSLDLVQRVDALRLELSKSEPAHFEENDDLLDVLHVLFVYALSELGLQLLLEDWLFVFVDDELLVLRGPHSKIISTTAYFVFDLIVLYDLCQALVIDSDLLRFTLRVDILGKGSQVLQELVRIVFDLVVKSGSHVSIPDQDRVLVVVPAIDLEEALLAFFVEILDERHW